MIRVGCTFVFGENIADVKFNKLHRCHPASLMLEGLQSLQDDKKSSRMICIKMQFWVFLQEDIKAGDVSSI